MGNRAAAVSLVRLLDHPPTDPTRMFIDPPLAEAMLARNGINRRIREDHVKKLAHSMAAGHWRINGEMIRFADDQTLIDGQHRLLAVIRSGVTIETFAFFGLDPKIMLTLDIGRSRTAADFLGMRGYKMPVLLSSTATLVLRYEHQNRMADIRFDVPEIIDCVERHEKMTYIVQYNGGYLRNLPPSAMTMIYTLTEQPPDKVRAFYTRVFKGIHIGDETDPCYRLRWRIMESKDKATRLHRDTRVHLCAKAWNAFVREQPLRQLWVAEGEAFPDIL